ncbi:MAG: hypothetical protein INR65_02815 [Gluconacetobacter diazotrophicus]|nr:hypothetical protein [Gluconacetobacter diazotrophicus]
MNRMISGVVLAAVLGALPAAMAAAPRHGSEKAVRPAAAVGPGWSATQCGREPVAPQVDTSTVSRFNASVDQVTAYDQAARNYNACVSRQATADQTAASNEARARIDAIQAVSSGVQKRIAANFVSLAKALKDGAPKGTAR